MLKSFVNLIWELIEIVFVSLSIFAVLYLFVMQPHKIKGESMEPNFHNNEFLLTEKLSYRFGLPNRYDVVVFEAPPDFREEFIKRIVGLPGEQVTLRDGQIYINGDKLDEPYLDAFSVTRGNRFLDEGESVSVPPGHVFVLGDNRSHSLDSRVFGFVAYENITGRAMFVYWPPSELGLISFE